MKFTTTLLSSIGALVLTTAPALAFVGTSFGGSAGPNGSLFVSVYDPVVGFSVVQELSHADFGGAIHYQQFLESAVTPDSGYSLTFNIDLSLFAPLGSNLDDIRWTVFAGDTGGNPGAPGQWGVLFTSIVGSGLNVANYTVNGATTAANNLVSACNGANSPSVCVGHYSEATYAGGGNWGDFFGGLVPAPGSTGLDSPLAFYQVTRSNSAAGAPAFVDQFSNAKGAATWYLDRSGVLTYSAPVPLPAAAWLLLSGLGVFGFLKRKSR